jgi:hypothetical protein
MTNPIVLAIASVVTNDLTTLKLGELRKLAKGLVKQPSKMSQEELVETLTEIRGQLAELFSHIGEAKLDYQLPLFGEVKKESMKAVPKIKEIGLADVQKITPPANKVTEYHIALDGTRQDAEEQKLCIFTANRIEGGMTSNLSLNDTYDYKNSTDFRDWIRDLLNPIMTDEQSDLFFTTAVKKERKPSVKKVAKAVTITVPAEVVIEDGDVSSLGVVLVERDELQELNFSVYMVGKMQLGLDNFQLTEDGWVEFSQHPISERLNVGRLQIQKADGKFNYTFEYCGNSFNFDLPDNRELMITEVLLRVANNIYKMETIANPFKGNNETQAYLDSEHEKFLARKKYMITGKISTALTGVTVEPTVEPAESVAVEPAVEPAEVVAVKPAVEPTLESMLAELGLGRESFRQSTIKRATVNGKRFLISTNQGGYNEDDGTLEQPELTLKVDGEFHTIKTTETDAKILAFLKGLMG